MISIERGINVDYFYCTPSKRGRAFKITFGLSLFRPSYEEAMAHSCCVEAVTTNKEATIFPLNKTSKSFIMGQCMGFSSHSAHDQSTKWQSV